MMKHWYCWLLIAACLWGCEKAPVAVRPAANPSTTVVVPDQPVTVGASGKQSELSSLPAEIKPASTSKPPEKKREIYNGQADARADIAAAVARARENGQRVLINWGANWCGWCVRLENLFESNSAIAEILHDEYQIVHVDVDTNEDLLKQYGAQAALPFLTVLDDSGKAIKQQRTGVLEEGDHHVPERVLTFLKEWAAPQQDASVALQTALEEAQASGRAVLLRVGTPSCGWCKVLGHFLDAHRALFEKDYVLLKVDSVRMKHGQEIAARYAPDRQIGVPWMVILDRTGTSVANSVGPHGNCGYPLEPREIDHFLAMLTSTRNHLTDDELQTIRHDLDAAREERQKRNAGR